MAVKHYETQLTLLCNQFGANPMDFAQTELFCKNQEIH